MTRTKRQDIDRLAALLDGDVLEDAALGADDRALHSLATLLVQARPEVAPMRSDFRVELRAQVLDAARQRNAEPALLTRMRERVERFKYSTGLATATGLASVSLAGGGVAGAAEYAQPGETLYPAKLGIEEVRLWADTDDATRGRRALSYAAERIDEAEGAAARDDMAGAETALRSATERTRQGREAITASGDDAALLDLVDALAAQQDALRALAPTLSGAAAQAAGDLSREVQAGLEDAGQVFSTPSTTPGAADAPAVPSTSSPAGPAGDADPSQPSGDSTVTPLQPPLDLPVDLTPPDEGAQPGLPGAGDPPTASQPTPPPVAIPPSVVIPGDVPPAGDDPAAATPSGTTTSDPVPLPPDVSGIIESVESVTGGVVAEGQ